MTAQDEVRKLITLEFEEIKARNSSYSLRSYAKKLKISASALSEIMNGKRNVSQVKTRQLLDSLLIDPATQSKILGRFKDKKATPPQTTKPKELTIEAFNVISNWYYFALLELTETEGFKSDPAWIAKRLKLNISEVNKAIKTLLNLEMLELTPEGTLKATHIDLATSSDIKSLALRKHQFQGIELAKTSLEQDDLSQRDMTSMTTTIDPSDLPEAKKMIKDFLLNFANTFGTKAKKEVVRVNVQLFPLTKN